MTIPIKLKNIYENITIGELYDLTNFFFLNKISINEAWKIKITWLDRKLSKEEKFFVKQWSTFFKEWSENILYENMLSYFSKILLKVPEDETFKNDSIENKFFIRYNILSLYSKYYNSNKILPLWHQNIMFISLLWYLNHIIKNNGLDNKINNDTFFKNVILSLPKILSISENDIQSTKHYPFSFETYFEFIQFTKVNNLYILFKDDYISLLKDFFIQFDKSIKENEYIKKNISLIENIKKNYQDLKAMLSEVEKNDEIIKKISKIDFFIKNKENILENIKKNVIWQDNIIDEIFPNIWKIVLWINKRPTTYLFLWSSGVWKTKLSEEIALSLWSEACIINLGNFFDKYAMASVLWAPPGYIWYSDNTIIEKYLISMLEKYPDWFIPVIVFDEIEKAHSAIHNLWLELFDRGTITLQSWKIIELNQSIIVLTSNLGINTTWKIWFDIDDNDDTKKERFKSHIFNELKNHLKPEIINRIDKSIIFNDLSEDNLKKIKKNIIESSISKYLSKNELLNTYIWNKKFNISKISEKVYNDLINVEFDNTENIRSFEKMVETKIYELIIPLLG